eukprot:356133-Chlamydomonas_euryale.AAC.19
MPLWRVNAAHAVREDTKDAKQKQRAHPYKVVKAKHATRMKKQEVGAAGRVDLAQHILPETPALSTPHTTASQRPLPSARRTPQPLSDPCPQHAHTTAPQRPLPSARRTPQSPAVPHLESAVWPEERCKLLPRHIVRNVADIGDVVALHALRAVTGSGVGSAARRASSACAFGGRRFALFDAQRAALTRLAIARKRTLRGTRVCRRRGWGGGRMGNSCGAVWRTTAVMWYGATN